MKKYLYATAGLLLLLVLYLAAWTVPVSPVAWVAPMAPGYTEAHSPNKRLAALQMLSLGGEEGPEHVAVGPDGKLYVAVASGKILRMALDGTSQEVFVNTGGRVLGFDFDAQGNLIAADAFKGLLSISPARAVTTLATQFETIPLHYLDAVVVAKSGKIYVSDASMHFAPADWNGTFEASVLDILEQSATGRVLEYDPATREISVVAKGFSFANGLVLSADQQSLFVAETGRYRIWQLPVIAKKLDVSSTERQTAAKVVLDNLPGYPDNLMRGADGRIWVGLVKPRDTTIDTLAGFPYTRKVILRLPRFLWPIPKAYGHVFAFTEDGNVVVDLQNPAGTYPETTGVTETADRLYVQSLHAKGLGWLPKK
jgi:sugar lactone lactonase YvrE